VNFTEKGRFRKINAFGKNFAIMSPWVDVSKIWCEGQYQSKKIEDQKLSQQIPLKRKPTRFEAFSVNHLIFLFKYRSDVEQRYILIHFLNVQKMVDRILHETRN
jgi:hypothetical protein